MFMTIKSKYMTKAVKNGFPVAVLFKNQKLETCSIKASQAFCIIEQTKNSVSLYL